VALGPLPGGAILQWGGAALWAVCLVWSVACAGGYVLYGRWRNARAG
jgi:hypothetical protein